MMNNAWKDEQLRSSLMFYTIFLEQVSYLTQSLWCFETHGRLPPRIKWSNSTKTKHSRSCSTNYSMPLSLSWLKMNEQKISLSERFFFFMNERQWKIYITEQTFCFSDNYCAQTNWLNNKIINIIINWISGPSPHMPKAQPNIQPKAHIFYYFQCGTQGFSPLIITPSTEHRKHQFLIHSMLFFQQSFTCLLIKHNANDDAGTERVEEKLLYRERWLLTLNLPLWKTIGYTS